MVASSEFSRRWAMAPAILLERDVEGTEDAAISTTGGGEDDGATEDVVKNRPANKLLKVECCWDMLRTKPMIARLINARSPHKPTERRTKHHNCQGIIRRM